MDLYKFNVDVDVDVDEQTSIEQKWFSECMVGGDSRGKKKEELEPRGLVLRSEKQTPFLKILS